MTLSHDLDRALSVTIEVDFTAEGEWHQYAVVQVPAAERLVHRFPDGFSAHWVRLRVDAPATVSAAFRYE